MNSSCPCSAVERYIKGLGSQPQHAPPMLAFLLGCYLSQGQEGLANSALPSLLSSLTADFCNNPTIFFILHSLAYTTLSAHLRL